MTYCNADGGDRSDIHQDVSGAGIIRFREIPPAECVPPISPVLSAREQRLAAADLGLPAEDAHRVRRIACIALPGYQCCIMYSRWFENAYMARRAQECPDLPRVLVICESVDAWRGQYGETALAELVSSFFRCGRPTVNWGWCWCTDEQLISQSEAE